MKKLEDELKRKMNSQQENQGCYSLIKVIIVLNLGFFNNCRTKIVLNYQFNHLYLRTKQNVYCVLLQIKAAYYIRV